MKGWYINEEKGTFCFIERKYSCGFSEHITHQHGENRTRISRFLGF